MALRAGIIGCGGIARQHLDGWLEIADRAEVVAVADTSEEALAAAGRRCCGAKRYRDYHEMIDAERLDAVDICLPHHLHQDAILTAVGAGLHWLCEKPLCMTLQEADRIEQAMSDKRLTAMSAHNQVFMPSLNEARRMMESGLIGQVYTIVSQDCFILGAAKPGSLIGTPVSSPIAPGTWRASRETMGGGELIDTGYHPSYRLLFLARSEPRMVAAVTGTYRNRQLDAEDTATILIRFDSGVTGTIRTSWAFPLPGNMHQFYVVGEKGTLYGSRNDLWYQPHGFPPTHQAFEPVNTFKAEVRHFVECIEQGKQPIQSYRDGIAVLKLILRAYRFVETAVGTEC